ncbi:MAG TPA: hypothetical protein VHE30_11455 [Polyangiaceae bacterium]|nr:hypothetical protein [Polyangiaceae bacterium]
MNRDDRRLSLAVFGLVLFSTAYFHSGGGWNENSRFDLVRALVDDHALTIDPYAGNTGDKALFRGHYYSDKAPGLSFLAAPVYALVKVFHGAFHTDHDFYVFALYVVNALTVSVAGALAAALVFRAARKLGATPFGAVVGALAYGLGSPAFPLSTMFFGHVLAALVLMLAYTLAAFPPETLTPARRTALLALLAASALVVEYPTFPAAVGLALYHVVPHRSRRTLLALAAGAVPVLALGGYLVSAFGSPVRTGYDLLSSPGANAEMHSHGLFGITYPKLGVIASLLIGHTRGLLPYSPVLILGAVGFLEPVLGSTSDEAARERRGPLLLALGVVLYVVLFVASYEWWQGGASFGSRHIASMLPFLALPVAFVADRRPRLAVALLAVSAFAMLVVTSVHPKPSENLTSPFWSFLLPSFFRGELALTKACPVFGSPRAAGHHPFLAVAPYDAFNLGMVLGGRGLKSLLPLVSVWGTAAWAFRRALRVEKTAERS